MSTNSAVTSSAETTSSEKYTGRVKWFNTKAGYGFVTVTDGSKSGSDVFVHHSAIKVESEQYRYLVQGEYVEFKLSSISGGSHEYQAEEVSGIKGGKLMCETRRDVRNSRSQYRSTKDGSVDDNHRLVAGIGRATGTYKKQSQQQSVQGWQVVKGDKPSTPVGPPPTRPHGSTPRAPMVTKAPRAPKPTGDNRKTKM
jgi:CspA family cold shock protein